MGQRHQAFIIAKVKPHGSSTAKHRCIAAYHSQWCYGTLPLRAARRVLHAVRRPENAEIIREELRAIDGKYGRYRQKPAVPQVPCPFIARILADNWDMDLSAEDAYFSGVSLENAMLHAGMDKWGGDNNDGITIIDVTNAGDPAYGFYRGHELEDAEGYIRHYYAIPDRGEDQQEQEQDQQKAGVGEEPDEESDPEEQLDAVDNPGVRAEAETRFERSILQAIDNLRDVRVLNASAVQEAWPSMRDLNQPEAEDHADDEAGASVPSLVDISLRKTLEQCIESGDISGLDDLPLLPEKIGVIDDMLRGLSPFPDTAVPLLAKLMKENKYRGPSVDLSGFPLTASQVVDVAVDLGGIHSLNLSRNDVITVADVRQLLERLPSLHRLVLIACPSIDPSELVTLVHDAPELFRHLQSLMHPTFMRIPEAPNRSSESSTSRTSLPKLPARMIVVTQQRSYPTMAGVSLPFASPAIAVQGLTDLLTGCVYNKDGGMFDMSVGRAIEAGFAALPRTPGTSWHKRIAAMTLPLDLDMFYGQIGGWALLLTLPTRLAKDAGWAFVRLRPRPQPAAAQEVDKTDVTSQESSESKEQSGGEKKGPLADYELHDLRSFLRATEQEGFPVVPEDASSALEALMQKAKWHVYSKERVEALITPQWYWDDLL